MMVRAFVLAVLACVVSFAITSPVHAGPIELFKAATIDPANADQIIAPYKYGQAGMIISDNGGKDYKLMCTSQISPSVANDQSHIVLNGEVLYIGVYDGLWRGDKNGCGFAAVPELMKHYIADVKVDPIDAKRTYVITTDAAPAMNGIWMNDSSMGTTFSPLGTQATLFINTLHVVKNGTGRRLYETGVKNDADPMSNVVHYVVRVSDDEAKTWTEAEYPLAMFGPADPFAEFEIVAVDPINPDHVFGRVHRSEMVDTLVYSPMQGKDGTWTMLAEVGELDAIEFTPEGVLYFGDDDQMRPGLFVVEKTGDTPKQLSDKWKVGCLTYDSAKKRMFACNDYRFGTADVTSGVFTSLFDMRCAKQFQECPGAAKSAHDACQGQLLAAYCGITHYPLAPICSGYDQGPGAPEYIAELEYSCQDGFPVPKPEGAAGSGGSGAAGAGPTGAAAVSGGGSVAQAGTSAAGASASAAGKASAAPAGAAAPAPTKSGGCGVMPGQSNGAVWAVLSLFAFAFFKRRQRA